MKSISHYFTTLIIAGLILFGQIAFGQARVQFIHNGSIAGVDTVDIWYGFAKVASNLRYRSATAFVSVPATVTENLVITRPNSTDPSNPLFSIPGTTFPTNGYYHYIAFGDDPLNVTISIQNALNPIQPRDTLRIAGFNGLITNFIWSLRFSRGSRPLITAAGGFAFNGINKVDTLLGRVGVDVLERRGNNTFVNESGSIPDSLLKVGKSCFILLSGATANTPPYEIGAFIIPTSGGLFIPLSNNVTALANSARFANGIISPNPTTSMATINLNGTEVLTAELIATDGKATKLMVRGQELDLQGIVAGAYYLKLTHAGGVTMTRLVIQ